MKNYSIFSAVVFSLVSLSACAPMQGDIKSPEGMDSSMSNPMTCTHKGETRVVERRAAGAGCDVNYTKGGKASVIGTSVKGMHHCDQVAAKIKKNLETAGWSCK
jgi:fumarylacetoacetate (FAA) hydrolase family protein